MMNEMAAQAWRCAMACIEAHDPHGAIMWLEDARDRYIRLSNKEWVIRCNRRIAVQRRQRTRMVLGGIFKYV